MNYRSVDDLNRLIVSACHRVPNDVDLIVGIPRSGMLAANLLALHLNLPVTDISGFLDNRLMNWGLHRSPKDRKVTSVEHCHKALIIDDSILSGRQMASIRQEVERAGLADKALFAAIYCTKDKANDVDLAFEICPRPRVFEWNLMHSNLLADCCVDIDGVLCVDPSESENDDGERYSQFITQAQSYLQPTKPLGLLVTSRLEKYRALTEKWLADHDIQFDKLIMMQYASMAERRADGKYADFKADVYTRSNTRLFIESDAQLACKIAAIAGKPVLAVDIQAMVDPAGLPYIRERGKQIARVASSLPQRAFRKILRIPHRVRSLLLRDSNQIKG